MPEEHMTKAARQKIREVQAKLAHAIEWQDPPAQRRAEKSLALATSKLLCAHLIMAHATGPSFVRRDCMTTMYRCSLCKLTAYA